MKITIARECGCYGDEVGQVLADRLFHFTIKRH